MSIVIAYLAGLVTLPVGYVLIGFFGWALSRTTGQSGCYVCPHGPKSEIGERRNLDLWLRGKWHDLFWSHRRWHVAAWHEHWVYKSRQRRTVPTSVLIPELSDQERTDVRP